MRFHATAFLTATLLLPAPASEAASSMRCGTELVQLGDSKLDVLSSCGEPALEESSELVTKGIDDGAFVNTVTFARDRWHYQCGWGRLDKVLVFEGGVLVDIEVGSRRGSGPRRCN